MGLEHFAGRIPLPIELGIWRLGEQLERVKYQPIESESKLEDGIESNFARAFRTRETADLFLILIMYLLKPGGRGVIVLPDGTLFGEGVKTRIKEKLMDECNLHTIVRLPDGVFNPYTGIKTNLLFFTKGQPTRDIWYPHNADCGPGDPDELLAELQRIRREGQQTLARLKLELAEALSDR